MGKVKVGVAGYGDEIMYAIQASMGMQTNRLDGVAATNKYLGIKKWK